MTQESYCWSCTAVGDGGPQSYSVEIVELINRIYGNLNPTTSGVVYWTDTAVFPGFTNPFYTGTPSTSFLTSSYLGANVMRIARGIGLVQGWIYVTDTVVDTTVSGGNANATDIIGLRRDLAGQTVRVFHGRGAAASTYSLVQNAATWEIPLVEVTLDGSGNYSSHTDVREFCITPLFPVQRHTDWENIVLGWEFSGGGGGAEVPPTGIVDTGQMVPGWSLSFASDECLAIAQMMVKEDMYTQEFDILFPIFQDSGVTPTGNVVFEIIYANVNQGGGSPVNVSSGLYVVSMATAAASGVRWSTITGSNITGVAGGTPLRVTLHRRSTNGSDTTTDSFYAVGMQIEYNKHNGNGFDTNFPIP